MKSGRQTLRLDSESKQPKVAAYLQIVSTIADRIASGAYPAGSKLPSESQFSAEFEVSAMTLRKALAILADQGLVCAEKGRGTFVRSIALSDTVFRLEQLDGAWLDDTPEIKLLAASTTKASARVAEKLGVAPGTRVVLLRRLIMKDGTAAMYHVEYVVFDARQPLVESQLQLTTLHGVLQAASGQGFPRGRVTLRAQGLDDEAAGVLKVPPGTPALCLEHVFEDAAQRPVSWGWFLMRADLFELTAQLGPD
jgi:GntR family transcriptional regulator